MTKNSCLLAYVVEWWSRFILTQTTLEEIEILNAQIVENTALHSNIYFWV